MTVRKHATQQRRVRAHHDSPLRSAFEPLEKRSTPIGDVKQVARLSMLRPRVRRPRDSFVPLPQLIPHRARRKIHPIAELSLELLRRPPSIAPIIRRLPQVLVRHERRRAQRRKRQQRRLHAPRHRARHHQIAVVVHLAHARELATLRLAPRRQSRVKVQARVVRRVERQRRLQVVKPLGVSHERHAFRRRRRRRRIVPPHVERARRGAHASPCAPHDCRSRVRRRDRPTTRRSRVAIDPRRAFRASERAIDRAIAPNVRF